MNAVALVHLHYKYITAIKLTILCVRSFSMFVNAQSETNHTNTHIK